MSEPFLLSISDLQLIRDILRESNFDETKWPDLGLSLGLLHTRIKSIKQSCSNDPHDCLLECLSSWLESGQARLPQTLANALNSISTGAAERIRKILIDPVSQLLLQHSDNLSWLILPEDLILLLRTEGVISKEVQSGITNSGSLLVGEALRAVCVTVAEDHNKLRVLAEVLLKFERTAVTGKNILEKYNNKFPETSDIIQVEAFNAQVVSTHPQLPERKEVRVSRAAHEDSFESMRGKFGTLIHDIVPLISSNTSLEKLRPFLECCYQELKPQLVHAKSVDDVLKITVKKKCNIVNVAALEVIINRYDITEGRNLVTEYKKEIENFLIAMKLTFTLNNKLSLASNSPLICERITFVLDWEPDNHPFDDIRLLMERAFDDVAKEVIVQIIHKTNSILIICYAPLHFMNVLLLEAQANLPVLLKEMNIIQLTIGHCTVYDRRQEKEIKSLQEEVTTKEESLLQYGKEVEVLKQSLKEKEKFIEALQVPATESELKEKLLLKENFLKKRILENEQLKSSLKSKAEAIADNMKNISELQKKMSQLSEENKSLQKKMSQLSEENTSQQKKINDLEDSKAELEKSLAESRKRIEELQEQSEEDELEPVEVFNSLTRCHFPEDRWYDLGMRLRIDKDVLDHIERDHTSASRCLTEVLSKWIEEEADDDDSSGANLELLSNALRSMNEYAVAEKLDQEKHNDLAYDILDHHCSLLTESLHSNLVTIARMLCEEHVITKDVVTSIESASTSRQVGALLTAVKEAVQSKYTSLKTFASVLCKFSDYMQIGEAILRDYEKYFSNIKEFDDPSPQVAPMATNVEIPVPRNTLEKIQLFRGKFARIIYNVSQIFARESLPLEKVKILLRMYNFRLGTMIADCSTTSDVMNVIGQECSLTDIGPLQIVLEEFDISDALNHIDYYQRELEHLCDSLSELLCLNKRIPASAEAATYVFDWRPDEYILKDITGILSKASGKFVKIRYIDTGY